MWKNFWTTKKACLYQKTSFLHLQVGIHLRRRHLPVAQAEASKDLQDLQDLLDLQDLQRGIHLAHLTEHKEWTRSQHPN